MSLPTPYYDRDGITLYCADCREILPLLEPVDLVLTDPPYAVSVAGSVHHGQPGKGSRNFDFFPGDADWQATADMVVESLELAESLCRANASFYAWVGHRYFGDVVRMLELRGWSTRFLVWSKKCPAPPPPGSGYPSAAELCVYAYRPGRRFADPGVSSNVIVADSFRHGQPGKVSHPTQKPAGVMRPLLLASSAPGDLVLDPFVGSGTTLVVAQALGRRCVGIEIEERYCRLAVERLRQRVIAWPEPTEAPA